MALSLPLPSSRSTKQMLADIVQFHPGDSLEEILSLTASQKQVSSQASLWVLSYLCPSSPPSVALPCPPRAGAYL